MANKISIRKPAILGGDKLFPERLHNARSYVGAYEDLSAQVRSCIESGSLTKGRYLEEYESEVAAYAGVKHAVALSSCTTGLILTHDILELKGEVIMPSFTFMATTLGAQWNNLKPVFVDIDAKTWNLDLDKVKEALTEDTCAIVGVHVFGSPADCSGLEKIATEAGVKLIFDSAHAFGARADGTVVGGNGVCEVFSTSATKLLVTGEGGLVTTNDDYLAQRLRRAREYGNIGDYNQRIPGLNGRLPEISAIIGLHSLKYLDEAIAHRNKLVKLFKESLADVPGLHWQQIADADLCTYKDLSCRIDAEQFGLSRDHLVLALEAEGIEMRTYYHIPCHLQDYWQKNIGSDCYSLPLTENLSDNVVSFPLWSNMKERDITMVAQAVRQIHGWVDKIRLSQGSEQ